MNAHDTRTAHRIADTMTPKQIRRLARRYRVRWSEGYGYQPFGFDRSTMASTRPHTLRTVDIIAAAHRIAEGKANRLRCYLP